jgi:hypothetical protein
VATSKQELRLGCRIYIYIYPTIYNIYILVGTVENVFKVTVLIYIRASKVSVEVQLLHVLTNAHYCLFNFHHSMEGMGTPLHLNLVQK